MADVKNAKIGSSRKINKIKPSDVNENYAGQLYRELSVKLPEGFLREDFTNREVWDETISAAKTWFRLFDKVFFKKIVPTLPGTDKAEQRVAWVAEARVVGTGCSVFLAGLQIYDCPEVAAEEIMRSRLYVILSQHGNYRVLNADGSTEIGCFATFEQAKRRFDELHRP